MSGNDAIRIVAIREAGDRLRNRAFVVGTLLVWMLVVAAVTLPALVGGDGPERYRLALAADVDDTLRDTLQRTHVEGVTVEVVGLVQLGGEDAVGELLEQGQADAVLLDEHRLMATDATVAPGLAAFVDSALRRHAISERLEALGVDGQQVDGLLTDLPSATHVGLDGSATSRNIEDAIMAIATTILLFLAIQINGSSLLTGAIEEKSNRVVEVLLGAVRPRQLLAGKLIASTLIAVAQTTLLVGSALIANRLVGGAALPAVTGSVVTVTLAMLVFGFLLYAALYTVAGSMASSIEDAQAIAGPLAIAVVATYVAVVFAVVPAPGGTVARVLTMLPPTAPFTVPARVALDAIPPWEVAAAFVAVAAGTIAAVRIGARLYATTLLAGGRMRWREAWRGEMIR